MALKHGNTIRAQRPENTNSSQSYWGFVFSCFVFFHAKTAPKSVWPSSAVPSQQTADGLAMDRRILFFLTESVWPSSDVPSKRTADGLATARRILFFLTESVWPSLLFPLPFQIQIQIQTSRPPPPPTMIIILCCDIAL